MKTDLSDVTFMIPVKIDCKERRRNLNYVVNYLCSNFKTNIMIVEADVSPKCDKFSNIDQDILHQFIELKEGEPFHRTKYLNHMIVNSHTPTVVNYDADVILPKESYIEAANLIKNQGADLVYPYLEGKNQLKIFFEKMNGEDLDSFIENFPFNLKPEYCLKERAEYGFCQFAKRQSYLDAGLENEDFISWGPEDYERFYRFKILGFNIKRCGSAVFHMEHPSGRDSSKINPHYQQNAAICEALSFLSATEIFWYILHRPYLQNYMEHYGSLFSFFEHLVRVKSREHFFEIGDNWVPQYIEVEDTGLEK